jgi:hypothetical protein
MKLNWINIAGILGVSIVVGLFIGSNFGTVNHPVPSFVAPLTVQQAERHAATVAALNGMRHYRVLDTGSMRPMIDSNHVVLLIDAWDKVAVGQVVGFTRDDGQAILHRVFNIDRAGNVQTHPVNGRGWDRQNITRADYLGTYVGGFVFTP